MICGVLLALLVVEVWNSNCGVLAAPIDPQGARNLTSDPECPILTWESCCDIQRSLNQTTDANSTSTGNSSSSLPSGKYTLGHYGPFSATYGYCDLETEGGGWLVVFRRHGEIDFNRNFTSYEDGFGDLEPGNSFWYGLKSLHHITSRDVWELRVDLINNKNGEKFHIVYANFSVGEASSRYTLHLGPRITSRSTAADSLRAFNGKKFFTRDRDITNCATVAGGGWWFGEKCGGAQGGVLTATQVNHYGWYSEVTGTPVKYEQTEMKIRQVSCSTDA